MSDSWASRSVWRTGCRRLGARRAAEARGPRGRHPALLLFQPHAQRHLICRLSLGHRHVPTMWRTRARRGSTGRGVRGRLPGGMPAGTDPRRSAVPCGSSGKSRASVRSVGTCRPSQSPLPAGRRLGTARLSTTKLCLSDKDSPTPLNLRQTAGLESLVTSGAGALGPACAGGRVFFPTLSSADFLPPPSPISGGQVPAASGLHVPLSPRPFPLGPFRPPGPRPLS